LDLNSVAKLFGLSFDVIMLGQEKDQTGAMIKKRVCHSMGLSDDNDRLQITLINLTKVHYDVIHRAIPKLNSSPQPHPAAFFSKEKSSAAAISAVSAPSVAASTKK
jgi:hypothetical protein